MLTRTLKVFGASSALVAGSVAFPALAAPAIATSTTTPLLTSETTGGIQVTGLGSIIATGTPAIEISSTTAADNIISVSTGGIIRSGGATQTSATIMGRGTESGAVTINNSGTIAAVSGAPAAIDTSALATNGLTLTNAGTISGSVTLGNAADTVTINNGGTLTGALTLGAGNNTFTINSGTLAGAYSSAAGTDAVTLINAIVTGAMTDSGTGDSDVLSISGTTFSTGGAIAGFETFNTSATTTNIAHGLTGVSSFGIASNSTVNVSNSFALAAGSTLTNSGTLHIGAGKTVSAATVNSANGLLSFDISDSTTAGKLIVGSDATGITTAQYLINLGSTAGYIANGTSYTLVDGSATATLGTIATSNTAVYTYNLSRASSNQDVVLTISRTATANVVTGADAQAAASALDGLGTAVSGTLYTVQSNIGSAATAAQVDAIVGSLVPTLEGAGAATLGVTQATGNQISTRLASLRGSGVAAGDAGLRSHVWLQGFGTHTAQDSKSGASGYSSNGGGVSLGLDSDDVIDGSTLGVAFSYSQNNVDSKAVSNGTTDINTYLATLYGSTVYETGMFLNTQLGMGWNNYDTERTVSGLGRATGSTDGYQGSVKMELGRDHALGNFTVTPLAGAQYTYLKMDSYTESGVGGASLYVKPEALNAIDLTAGGQLAYTATMENGSSLKPVLRAKYLYSAGDTGLATTSHFTGGGANFKTAGVKADRSGVNVGAGLTLSTISGMDITLDYDADLRSSLTAQTGQLKARWAF